MKGVDMTGGAGRGLLSTVLLCGAIVVTAVVAMVAVSAGSPLLVLWLVVPLLGVGALTVALRAPRWRMARERRRLRRRVIDPHTLAGDWRRLLIAAWSSRDEFAAVVAGYGSSPIGERLASQQLVMDAALERCGVFANDGHRLMAQLRAFRPRRLRRDLLIERGRHRNGARAAALARQLDDVAQLRDELDRVQLQLEDQVHDMRTAAWHASTLRSQVTDEPDVALTELLDELEHLRAALAEVERPAHSAAAAS